MRYTSRFIRRQAVYMPFSFWKAEEHCSLIQNAGALWKNSFLERYILRITNIAAELISD